MEIVFISLDNSMPTWRLLVNTLSFTSMLSSVTVVVWYYRKLGSIKHSLQSANC